MTDEFIKTASGWLSTLDGIPVDFTTLHITRSTAPYTRCYHKGSYIPIYQIWNDFYTSDFNFQGSANQGYYKIGTNNYSCGCVIANSQPFIDGNSAYIGLIVAERRDTQPRTQAERIAEIQNQQYIYETNIVVGFGVVRYNSQYDYTKYMYQWSVNPSANECLRASDVNTGDLIGLAGFPSWNDGDGSGLLNVNTLLFPVIQSTYLSDAIFVGLKGRIAKYGAMGQTSINFSDFDASEDPDDFISVFSGNSQTGKTYYSINEYNAGTHNIHLNTDITSGYTPPSPPEEHPFEEDYNGGGGGAGDYTDQSDEIPIDGVPSNSAIASGFVNAYLLTQQNAIDFHSYLYTGNFAQNVAKLMNDPIDYIIDFMLAPYTPDTSASTNIIIGGTDSEVNAMRISSGYKTVDCGSVQLKEFWGKFYDYNPYTKLQIYLPFIGVRPLDVDETMAGNVSLVYRIDVLSGECVATVSVNNARGTKGAIYNFNGNCQAHIPVTGKNSLSTGLNIEGSFVGMASGIATGNVAQTVSGAINTVKSAKAEVEHGGNLAGQAGLLANFTPFLIVSRPSQSLARNYNHYRGFISNVTAQLGTLSGYTQVAELVQTDIHCTETEFDEINTLLKEGVYL